MSDSLPSKSKEYLQYPQSGTLCVGTSDSFDDMLDENDDELLQIATTGRSSNLSSSVTSHKAHPLQYEKADESNHCRNGKSGAPHLLQ